MKALFLAGGMGSRLRPLTESLPKPMLPIMGKPLLAQSMEQLIVLGVHEFILSVHYQSKLFQRYFDVHKKSRCENSHPC